LKSKPLIWFAKKLEVSAYRNSTNIVACSPDMCAGVVANGVAASAVHNIPNSSDFDLFAVDPKHGLDFRSQHDWLGGRPLVLYTGTLGKINGVGYMVKLAAKVFEENSDIRFLVVGDGVEKEEVEKSAKELGVLGKNFFMLPPMPKTKLVSIVSAATIVTSFVIPVEILWGNSANKFFDGLAAGKPIAINHEGWQADMIRENELGLVMHQKNIAEASDHLVRLVTNESRLRSMSNNATSLGKAEFSRDLLAQKLIAVLVLSEPAP